MSCMCTFAAFCFVFLLPPVNSCEKFVMRALVKHLLPLQNSRQTIQEWARMGLPNKKIAAAAKAVRARSFPSGWTGVSSKSGSPRVPGFVSFLIRNALDKSDSAVFNVFTASLPFVDTVLV